MKRIGSSLQVRFSAMFLLGAVFHATVALASQPAECGDIDGDGKVVAADALIVLRKAAGLPIPNQCIVVGATTSTTIPAHA